MWIGKSLGDRGVGRRPVLSLMIQNFLVSGFLAFSFLLLRFPTSAFRLGVVIHVKNILLIQFHLASELIR